MATLNDLVTVLAAQAPRDRAAKVLDLLIARTRAEAGAVLAFKNDDIVVFATSRDIPVTRITEATDLWKGHLRQLRSGHRAEAGGNILAPIRDGETTAALVYLAAPQAFDPVSISTFSDAIVKAVQANVTGEMEDPLETWLPRAQNERERLTAILNRNEGNIARVARLLGVTRRTIYLRMQRFGVPRLKMPRTNTPRRPKTTPA